MKIWQVAALISGTIISTVMAFASVSYTATLGTTEPIFAWLPIPNSFIFGGLALAFDLGMIASVFGMLHWWPRHRARAFAALALFLIASLFSIHAVRGYVASTVTKAAAPAAQQAELYRSLKLDLQQAQDHLGQLQASYTKVGRRDRKLLQKEIAAARDTVQDAHARLAQADAPAVILPLTGFEWSLAIILWFFNATCWTAWFGPAQSRRPRHQDTVIGWLATQMPSEPKHCGEVFSAYTTWCRAHGLTPLAQYSFYARLIELGARKFRDGRNGPTMYALPERRS